MKLSSTVILSLAVCIGLLTEGNQLNAQTIKFTPKKGTSLKYDLSMNLSQTMNAMGNEITTNGKTTSRSLVEVNNTDANGSELTYSIASMKIAISGLSAMGRPDTTINIKELDQFSQAMTVGTNGKIIKSAPLKKGKNGMEAQLVNQMANNRGLMEMLFIGFPDKKLAVGDTWKETRIDTNKQGDDGMIITNTTYKCTYAGVMDTLKTKCHKINIVTEKMTMSGNASQMGMEMNIEGDGATKGTAYYDVTDGTAVAVISNAQADARMSISGQEQMVIPITMDIKSSMVRAK